MVYHNYKPPVQQERRIVLLAQSDYLKTTNTAPTMQPMNPKKQGHQEHHWLRYSVIGLLIFWLIDKFFGDDISREVNHLRGDHSQCNHNKGYNQQSNDWDIRGYNNQQGNYPPNQGYNYQQEDTIINKVIIHLTKDIITNKIITEMRDRRARINV